MCITSVLLQAKKSQTVETNLKNITLAKFDLDFEVSMS